MLARQVISLLLLLSACLPCFALDLRPHPPNQYVVKPGDTLWSIAGRFLHKPWQWKQLWRQNPQIRQPNKLYPGDVLVFDRYRGKAYLTVGKKGVIKLSPRVRATQLDAAIPAIPLGLIKPFLSHSVVFDHDRLASSPYIVAVAGEHLAAGAGYRVYVRGQLDPKTKVFSVFHPGKTYRDPVNKEVLGYGAEYVGRAELQQKGDPATFILTQSSEDVLAGDRLVPIDDEQFDPAFIPEAPKADIYGEIIDLVGGLTQVGSNQIVLVNKGSQDGLAPGNVLSIYQNGELVNDPYAGGKTVQLPNENVGELMIFKTFRRVSYGLVMRATAPIRLADSVTTPKV